MLTLRWSKPDSNSTSHPLTRSRSLGGAGASGSVRQDRRRHRRSLSLIRESALGHFLAFALTTNAIVPTDLVAEKAKRAPQMLEAAEADLALEAGFVHVKARQAFPEIGRQVRRREQTAVRASRWRRRSCRALPDAPAPPKLRDRVRGWDLEFESGLLQQPVCLSSEP